MPPNKLPHQSFTLSIPEIHNLNTALLQIVIAAHEGVVLAHDDPRDFVQDAGAGAHVAGGERGVHGRAVVGGGGEAAGGL